MASKSRIQEILLLWALTLAAVIVAVVVAAEVVQYIRRQKRIAT